jgi:hypothetical protein
MLLLLIAAFALGNSKNLIIIKKNYIIKIILKNFKKHLVGHW